MKIKIKKGLDLPFGKGDQEKVHALPTVDRLALDLSAFETTSFKLLKKEGEGVKVGEPIAQDKKCLGRLFVSPASGTIQEIVRGLKRRLLSVVIHADQKQTPFEQKKGTLFDGGIAPHIGMRPGIRMAHPDKKPEVIFVKAIESAPLTPPAELQVKGYEEYFAAGLKVLQEIAPVHLVFREGSHCKAFINAPVEVHAARGPHPIANPSVHIAAIHPITRADQVVWTLDVVAVITLGRWSVEGVYHTERVITVAQEGVKYCRVYSGYPMGKLFENPEGVRLISGDPLTGEIRDKEGFLGFHHTVACALKDDEVKRERFHFFKFSRKDYTASKAYFFRRKAGEFSTMQHGEERAFVDGAIYDRVMPLPIETMPLIKVLLTEEYDKGEALGLLGVLPEDFALPAFVCPSKIEMVDIVKNGLNAYAGQYFDDE
ncbi:MAG: NADH:ubiquinone reductase (Na(+)-transporting) subunit A [Chlamydiia bacterium]|nr:NADH:ubiquinone reductase (Na(+)-transporting) subunit A [Chlamydiia bacterium]